MAERVETGGMMRFDYSKNEKKKLGKKDKEEIERAYEMYYERKRREKRRKRILWGVAIILLLLILAFFLFFSG